MPHLSISQLAELTGRERRTVMRLMEKLQRIDGDRGAHLYDRPKRCRSFMPWTTQKPRARHRGLGVVFKKVTP
jgi:hypothetical protein